VANDRIIIKCDTCGASKTLMKYYPTLMAETPVVEMYVWMYQHSHPPCREISYDLDGAPGFTLTTESADEPPTIPSQRH
jgi:hypothetical protein